MIRNYINDFNLSCDTTTMIKIFFTKILNRSPSDSELNFFLSLKISNILKLNSILHSTDYLSILTARLAIHKKSSRFALQISGHFRNFDKFKNQWISFMQNNSGHNFDIFIHTWNGTGERTNNTWIDDSNKINNMDDIIKIFNPKQYLVEDTDKYLDKFSVYNNDKNIQVFYNVAQPSKPNIDFSRFIVAQLYSIHNVNSMRNEYETVNNFKYDFVFRIRADTFVNIDFDSVSKLRNDENILYVNSSKNHAHPLLGRGCAACNYEYPNKSHKDHSNLVCDAFYYGSGTMMDKISSIYLHHMKLLKDFEEYNSNVIRKEGTIGIKKNIFPGYIVMSHYGEELVYKCFYPERLIIEYAKNDFLITDPVQHLMDK